MGNTTWQPDCNEITVAAFSSSSVRHLQNVFHLTLETWTQEIKGFFKRNILGLRVNIDKNHFKECALLTMNVLASKFKCMTCIKSMALI